MNTRSRGPAHCEKNNFYLGVDKFNLMVYNKNIKERRIENGYYTNSKYRN